MADEPASEPSVFVDRVSRVPHIPVPVPDLSFRPDDPASLYARRLNHLEVVVISLLAEGYSFRDIASRRRIRQYYVRDIVKSVCRKLDLPSRYALLCAWECELFHEGMWALRLTPYPTNPRR